MISCEKRAVVDQYSGELARYQSSCGFVDGQYTVELDRLQRQGD